jgi:hypothetical protein
LGDGRNVYRIFIGKPEGKRPFDILGIDVRIILKCTLNKVERRGLNLPGSEEKFLKAFPAFRITKRHEGVRGIEVNQSAFFS